MSDESDPILDAMRERIHRRASLRGGDMKIKGSRWTPAETMAFCFAWLAWLATVGMFWALMGVVGIGYGAGAGIAVAVFAWVLIRFTW